MLTQSLRFILIFILMSNCAFAVDPGKKNLPIGLAPHELHLPKLKVREKTAPPDGKIRALGEWEDSDGVMTLWQNSDYVQKLTEHGKVFLFADDHSAESDWKRWLSNHDISQENVSFFLAPTDSVWIRDYGPWFILFGEAEFGMVDTVYNRPRPQDDEIPAFIAKELDIPRYAPELVHTGGNFYPDGLGRAFSSTLVYSENDDMSKESINGRMKDYLGIEQYTTSKLSPGITIQHIDTFGKLVAPDTFVFSEFSQGSQHRKDSEAYVEKLKALKSPYGTPYKIHRMKMVKRPGHSGEDYRAFLNSFISNKVLYYPTYGGDAADQEARRIYQEALPGYEIVGVDADGTEWGDSIHCRSRNLLSRKATFIFPTVKIETDGGKKKVVVEAEIAANDSPLAEEPAVNWKLNGTEQTTVRMSNVGTRFYKGELTDLDAGDKVSLFIETKTENGRVKTVPATAPEMNIDVQL